MPSFVSRIRALCRNLFRRTVVEQDLSAELAQAFEFLVETKIRDGTSTSEARRLAAIGVVAGLAGAFSLTRVMASLLFNVRPDDPATYLAISFLLIVVAFLACYLPARRAAKLDPVIALSRT